MVLKEQPKYAMEPLNRAMEIADQLIARGYTSAQFAKVLAMLWLGHAHADRGDCGRALPLFRQAESIFKRLYAQGMYVRTHIFWLYVGRVECMEYSLPGEGSQRLARIRQSIITDTTPEEWKDILDDVLNLYSKV